MYRLLLRSSGRSLHLSWESFSENQWNLLYQPPGKSNESKFKQYKNKSLQRLPSSRVMYDGKKREDPGKEFFYGDRSPIVPPQVSNCTTSLWNHEKIPKPREGFDHILSKKGKKRASADVGFIFIAYNLRQISNLIGEKALKKVLKPINRYFSSFINGCRAILGFPHF